jgi:hypothetical protein
LVTARYATKMQVEASPQSRSSLKRKRTKNVRPTDTTKALNVTSSNTGKDGRRHTLSLPHLQPVYSNTRTAIQSPRSLGPTVPRQLFSPAEPVFVRAITARSRLFMKSVKARTSPGPVSPLISSMLSRAPLDLPIATYIKEAPVRNVVGSQPTPLNSPLNSRYRQPHQPISPASRAPLSCVSSAQEILSALRPPAAQIVLSSTLTTSGGNFLNIRTEDSGEPSFDLETHGTPALHWFP